MRTAVNESANWSGARRTEIRELVNHARCRHPQTRPRSASASVVSSRSTQANVCLAEERPGRNVRRLHHGLISSNAWENHKRLRGVNLIWARNFGLDLLQEGSKRRHHRATMIGNPASLGRWRRPHGPGHNS